MTKRKKVLVLSYSCLNSDPRVLRQLDVLKEDYDIYTAGLTAWGMEKQFSPLDRLDKRRFLILRNCTFISIYDKISELLFLKLLKLYRVFYWGPTRQNDLRSIPLVNYDLIIANDLRILPLAVKVKKKTGAKLFFDAHEYSPLEYENDRKWLKWNSPYQTFLTKHFVRFTDHRVTVGENIASKYEELTGLKFGVVYNAPAYQKLDPSKVGYPIQFVHHGAAAPIRELERMIQVFRELPKDKFLLNLILIKSDPGYYDWLVELSGDSRNILFHDPVPTTKIPGFINQFDVGFIIIPPVNYNYQNCLPNKFFESIQARLMLACGGSDEEKRMIMEYDLGIHFPNLDKDEIVKKILRITPETVTSYKQSVNKSAEILSANRSHFYLKKVFMELLSED